MTEPKKDETAATGTGSAGAAAETAGAVAAAPAAEGKPKAEAKPKVTAEPKAERPVPTVVVTGPEKGRWRNGRKFNREPVSIPMTELTVEDVMRLQADPELHVQIIDAPH